jgi:regulator of protease activity HflC (stomatin/prohibitin superfamily)
VGWLVLTIILGLIGGGAIIAALLGADVVISLLVSACCLVAFFIVTLVSSVYTVGQRQVGVQYNFAGTVTGKKDSGWGFKAPWTHLKIENVGIQREDFDLALGDNSASTKDQQQISAHVTVNFHVEPNHVVDLYKRVGPNWKKILLDSRALQDFKEVVSQYTAAQVTTERPALRKDTKQRLAAELSPYDVHVDDVFVTNLGYTQTYRDAINAKNVQVQQALQAEAKVAQSRAEADQEVAKAEGDKRAAIARAEGTSKANKLIAASITDRLIAYKRALALASADVIYVPTNWTAFGNLGTASK